MSAVACAVHGAVMTQATLEAQRQQALVQKVLEESTGAYMPYISSARTHRCAYCHTLDSASVRCPSCGAPR